MSEGPAAKRPRVQSPQAALEGGPENGVSFQAEGLTLTDRFFTVPLDHTGAVEGDIQVFAREVVATSKAADESLPWLVFFQGGPGFESPRPTESSGWLATAADRFRVLLLDQRGTGRSTPVTAAGMTKLGGGPEQAAYLAHFRADSIVRDAELIRSQLLPAGEKWTTLGQSYGGFLTLTYLSLAPEGLKQCLVAGGLAPVFDGMQAERVYEHTYKRVAEQNRRYYERFPGDAARVRDIVRHLAARGGVALPGGGTLTPEALQLVGVNFGQVAGLERVHYWLETAWTDGTGELSYSFLRGYEGLLAYDTNPIFAILHEAIYCNGGGRASAWAAHRLRQTYGGEYDAVACAEAGSAVPFTGEMMYPWMFEQTAALQPLREAADLLAAKDDWPALYDLERLRNNTVPVAAIAYYEDMYVDMYLSQETVDTVKGIRMWVTNEYLHSGLREAGAKVITSLFDKLDGISVLR